jgi:hypothetical protein|tara:strand:- start:5425 stop:5760 length:336 start_codon:yes stop_codon:yes gene_type:complete
MKDIVKDGLQTTTYNLDEQEEKVIVKEETNIDSHLKHNKELLNSNDGYSKSRDLKRVASIPLGALQIWASEFDPSTKGNWWKLPKETQSKILKLKLNSSEFKYFRTSQGRI